MASGSELVRSFRRQAYLVIALIALASVAGAIVAQRIAGTRSTMELEQSAKEILAVQVQVLNGVMEKFRLLPNLIGRIPAVIKVFSDPTPQNIERARSAIRHDAAMTGALDIILFTLDGQPLVSAAGLIQQSLAENSPLLSAVRQGRLGREALQFLPDTRAYVFAAGLRDAAGELWGVIAVLVDLENLEQAWSLSTLPVLVVDRAGTILASNRSQWRMQSLRDIRQPEGGLFSYDLNGTSIPYIEVTRELPELQWRLHVLADAGAIGKNQFLAIAAVVLGGLLVGFFVFNLMNRRLAVTQESRKDRANSLRLERVVRDRTRELRHSNIALEKEVSHHRETGTALRKTQDELIQTGKLAALGQMSTALSHEFNQPLAATKSYADNALVLLERDREEEARENIRLISKMADRMAIISRHLRNFGRKPKSRLSAISVEAVIADAVEVLAVRLRDEGARVEFESRLSGIKARAGHVRLQQVVVNLISNALDASGDISKPVIEVKARHIDGKIHIFVRDRGTGILATSKEQIFDPFFTTKDPGSGLGLGLSISYNIIKDFGGRLSARNNPEGGAQFTIELDVVRASSQGQEGFGAYETSD